MIIMQISLPVGVFGRLTRNGDLPINAGPALGLKTTVPPCIRLATRREQGEKRNWMPTGRVSALRLLSLYPSRVSWICAPRLVNDRERGVLVVVLVAVF
jgi:hypothetical protein